MIEEQILAALATLFGGRVFPDTAPQGTEFPFCTFQQIGGSPVTSLCGDAQQQNARIQFNVWSLRRVEANQMMRAAAAILTEPPLRGVSQGALVAIYEEPMRTYGARQDFSFWF